MALIKCDNCGGNVSDKAKTCPHCGRVLNQDPRLLNKARTGSSTANSTHENSTLKKRKQWIVVCSTVITIVALMVAGYYWHERQRIPDSIRPLYEAANSGDAKAQLELGNIYRDDYDFRDYTEAVKWYRKAAQQGLAEAQFELGRCYQFGMTDSEFHRDIDEAVKWYSKAVELDYDKAQMQLGDLYENGNGVPQDISRAVELYRLAAKQENYDAIAALDRLGY